LLTELGTSIHGYLRGRFGAADFVEDCVQESLLGVHAARHTYDPSRPFDPWLFAIVRHKTVDWLRRMERLDGARARTGGVQAGAAAGGSAADALPACLSRLEPLYRDIVVLTKLQGLSVAEAARRLAISVSAAKVRVHRGLKRLKRILEDLDEHIPQGID
jgi:RNA polymerase sigma-70 factor (ECF subfamily)